LAPTPLLWSRMPAAASLPQPQDLWPFSARDEAIGDALEQSLSDPGVSVVLAAVRGLCRVRPHAARAFLGKGANRKRLLAELGRQEILAALMSEVAEAENRPVRSIKCAPWRFAEIDEYTTDEYDPLTPDSEQVPVLLAALRGQVAASELGLAPVGIVEALGRAQHPTAVPALLALVKDGPDLLRAAALTALGEIGDCDALDPIRSHADRCGKDAHVALQYVIEQLGRVRTAAQHLVSALSESSRVARLENGPVEAISRLGRTGYSEGVSALRIHLRSDDARVRVAACRALGRLRSPDASRALLRLGLAEQEPPAVRAAAVRAAGKCAGPDVPEALSGLVIHESEDIRAAAMKAAGNLGRKRLLPALIKIALKRLVPFRDPALAHLPEMAMTKIGADAAVSVLGSALSSPSAALRLRAVETLGHVVGAHAVVALLGLLPDPDVRVRTRAVTALASQATSERTGSA